MDDPSGISFFIGKGLSDSGSGSSSGILSSAQACAENGARIISMSLGGGSPSNIQRDAYRALYAEDNVLIVAAGEWLCIVDICFINWTVSHGFLSV